MTCLFVCNITNIKIAGLKMENRLECFSFLKKFNFFFGRFGRTRQMRKMLFQTPSWIENNIKAKRLLIFYRFTGIAYILIFLSPILLLFL